MVMEVTPSATIIAYTPNPLDVVETAGRCCYQSTKKGNPEGFIERRIREGHESILEHVSVTVELVTDRGVSAQLERHRIANYSQESTRYIKYDDLQVVRPLDIRTGSYEYIQWLYAMNTAEYYYKKLLYLSPEVARDVLPLCTKTEIVVTMNIRMWRHVIRERYLNEAAHPKIREIIGLVFDELNKTELECFFRSLRK